MLIDFYLLLGNFEKTGFASSLLRQNNFETNREKPGASIICRSLKNGVAAMLMKS
jgi:hypothetical protein